MSPLDDKTIPFKFTSTDYQFLSGTWTEPRGAAFNVTGEDCFEAGLGYYGQPTEKGRRFIAQFLEGHRL